MAATVEIDAMVAQCDGDGLVERAVAGALRSAGSETS